MRGTGFDNAVLYPAGKWIVAQLNAIAVTGIQSPTPHALTNWATSPPCVSIGDQSPIYTRPRSNHLRSGRPTRSQRSGYFRACNGVCAWPSIQPLRRIKQIFTNTSCLYLSVLRFEVGEPRESHKWGTRLCKSLVWHHNELILWGSECSSQLAILSINHALNTYLIINFCQAE